MTREAVGKSQRLHARIAGLAYLLTTGIALLTWNMVDNRLIAPDSILTSLRNVQNNEGLYRLGLSGDLVMFAVDVLLIVSLYVTLRPVNQPVAILGLLWRLSAAVIGAVAILMGLFRLQALNGGNGSQEGACRSC